MAQWYYFRNVPNTTKRYIGSLCLMCDNMIMFALVHSHFIWFLGQIELSYINLLYNPILIIVFLSGDILASEILNYFKDYTTEQQELSRENMIGISVPANWLVIWDG